MFPCRIACAQSVSIIKLTDGWHLFTPRHALENSLAGHLIFALKWEGLNLLILKRLLFFTAVDPERIVELVREQPTGSYARSIWFLCSDRNQMEDAELVGDSIYEYHAATEGGGTLVTPQEWRQYPGTVGRP